MGIKSMNELAEILGVKGGFSVVNRPAISDKFRRVNDTDTSTIFCSCGSSFTWGFCDDRLYPWLEIHTPHLCDALGVK